MPYTDNQARGMRKRTLKFQIISGDKECLRCPFVGSKKFGTKFVCLLVRDSEGREIDLFTDQPFGFLQRSRECIELETQSALSREEDEEAKG